MHALADAVGVPGRALHGRAQPEDVHGEGGGQGGEGRAAGAVGGCDEADDEQDADDAGEAAARGDRREEFVARRADAGRRRELVHQHAQTEEQEDDDGLQHGGNQEVLL